MGQAPFILYLFIGRLFESENYLQGRNFGFWQYIPPKHFFQGSLSSISVILHGQYLVSFIQISFFTILQPNFESYTVEDGLISKK